MLVIPGLPLVIVISAYLESRSLVIVGLILGITGWAGSAIVLRLQAKSLRARDYVSAARVAGEKTPRIILVEIFPNLLPLLTAQFLGAVLLAILNYIPYLGPFLAGVPPLLDAFVSTEFHWLIILSAIYWAIIILEGYLIVPLVMGRSMDLNAVTVMLACLFWELVWGMTGLFLAMPIMAGVKSVCMHVPGWRPWANLMSAEEIDVKSEGTADSITDEASPADAR